MQRNKVLVVDDEPIVLSLTVAILKRAGYETVIATNGREALMLCEEMKAELALILSDVNMPEMNGKELAESVARMSNPIPVILMSGYSTTGPLITGSAKGRPEVCGFIAKPFAPGNLLKAVSDVMNGSSN